MYNAGAPLAGSAAGAGTLAATGMGADSVWMVLGAFALISAGMALARVAPKRQA